MEANYLIDRRGTWLMARSHVSGSLTSSGGLKRLVTAQKVSEWLIYSSKTKTKNFAAQVTKDHFPCGLCRNMLLKAITAKTTTWPQNKTFRETPKLWTREGLCKTVFCQLLRKKQTKSENGWVTGGSITTCLCLHSKMSWHQQVLVTTRKAIHLDFNLKDPLPNNYLFGNNIFRLNSFKAIFSPAAASNCFHQILWHELGWRDKSFSMKDITIVERHLILQHHCD